MCVIGKWDPNEYPVEDLMRGCLLLLEVGIMQPKLQVLGGTVIVDCEGIGMKHARQLTPSVALQAINVMGVSISLFFVIRVIALVIIIIREESGDLFIHYTFFAHVKYFKINYVGIAS